MHFPKQQSAARAGSSARVIVVSFAAGVGFMMAVGLLAPIAAKGGLSLASADAATTRSAAAAIAPLDLAAVEAKLQEAAREMETSRRRTDGAMNRLDRLSGG